VVKKVRKLEKSAFENIPEIYTGGISGKPVSIDGQYVWSKTSSKEKTRLFINFQNFFSRKLLGNRICVSIEKCVKYKKNFQYLKGLKI